MSTKRKTTDASTAAIKAAPLTRSKKGPPAKTRGNKLDVLVVLLRRPKGAAISEMMKATGWQAHSVRGAIAGALKKTRGLPVVSEKSEAGRIYRIAAEA